LKSSEKAVLPQENFSFWLRTQGQPLGSDDSWWIQDVILTTKDVSNADVTKFIDNTLAELQKPNLGSVWDG